MAEGARHRSVIGLKMERVTKKAAVICARLRLPAPA